jgi:ATP-dependent helicase/nuclease subunit B
MAGAGRRFLGEFFEHGSEREASSLESIGDRLEDLMAVDASGDGQELAGMLVELMRDHRVGISAAREGRLYAVPITRAGYSGREVTFVLGLDEASFPGGAVEDPLLPDHERRSLSGQLGERLARPGDRVWELLRFLGSIPGPVTLVANRFDLVDGRERYASSVFAQCREDLEIKRPEKYAPSFKSSHAITRSDAWLSEREAEGYRPAVEAGFPSLAAGAEARRQRSSPVLTRYDGYLGAETPELSLTDGKILSASRLERLASCPHRYFLQDVLHVRPLDDVDEDDQAWLDAREFGSLVHEVLCEFMRTMKERGERPAWDRHRDDLHVLAEESAREVRTRIPPETEMAYQADVQRLKRTTDVFLAADSSADYQQALEFEMRFGWDSDSPRYPNPVTLDLGEGVVIRLRGSIDRVDVTRDGFVVWDYKTGSSAPFDRSDLFAGEKLQWALYALAYRSMLEGLPTSHRVARSGYFFVSERESGRRMLQRVPAASEIGRRLGPLVSMARNGAFFHFQRLDKKSSPCRFCDFKSICEKERRGADTLEPALGSELPQDVLAELSQWMNL